VRTSCRTTNAIDWCALDIHHDAAVTSLIPALSRRSCRPNAPFAELVRLSRTSIEDEMREEHRRRILGDRRGQKSFQLTISLVQIALSRKRLGELSVCFGFLRPFDPDPFDSLIFYSLIGLEGGEQRVLARAFNLFSGGRRIYRLSAFGFRVDIGSGRLGGPEAPIGRYRRISHHGQKEVERR
jgi:hypothetical protein